jgi:hypothetical protein
MLRERRNVGRALDYENPGHSLQIKAGFSV